MTSKLKYRKNKEKIKEERFIRKDNTIECILRYYRNGSIKQILFFYEDQEMIRAKIDFTKQRNISNPVVTCFENSTPED